MNPVIELGSALRARGHAVTLATSEIFSKQVQENGLDFAALGTRAEGETLMRDPRLWNRFRGFTAIVEQAILPNISRLYRMIEERQGPDLVVAATTLCLGARVAQDRLGVPTASLHLQPSVIRSQIDYARLGAFNMGASMPRWVKRGLFWVMDTLYVERSIGPGLNAFRREIGLAPVSGIFSSYIHSPELVLGLFPDWFAAPQPDWPAHTHLTGFLLHDSGGHAEAQGDAEAFLDEGAAPVLVTPGSAATDRTTFFRHTVKACQAAGVRAMLVTNHPDQLPRDLPSGIRAFPYLPFGQVLPRCAAIVYHGGIGTLAQAVKAGIPQLVVANAHDQPDNGQRIERLGLGLGLETGGYTQRSARRAIRELVTSEPLQRRCREFSPRVDSARSAAEACGRLEALGEGALAHSRDQF